MFNDSSLEIFILIILFLPTLFFLGIDLFFLISYAFSKSMNKSDDLVEAKQGFLSDTVLLVPIYNNLSKISDILFPKLLSYKNYEFPMNVILVDSSTNGDQDELIKRLGLKWESETEEFKIAKSGNLSVYHLKNRNGAKAWAINKVLKEFSNYQFFSVVDSDRLIDFDLLQQACTALKKNPNLVYTQLSWDPQAQEGSVSSKLDFLSVHHEYSLEDFVRDLHGCPITMHGSHFVMRVSDFINENGFDDGYLSEDVELSTRFLLKGRQGLTLTNLKTNDYACGSFKEFFWQKFRWVEGRSQVLKKYFFKILGSSTIRFFYKMLWLHYLAYFFRFVFFGMTLGMFFTTKNTDVKFAAFLCTTSYILIRFFGYFLMILKRRVSIKFALYGVLEAVSFYILGLFYIFPAIKGVLVRKGTWRV